MGGRAWWGRSWLSRRTRLSFVRNSACDSPAAALSLRDDNNEIIAITIPRARRDAHFRSPAGVSKISSRAIGAADFESDTRSENENGATADTDLGDEHGCTANCEAGDQRPREQQDRLSSAPLVAPGTSGKNISKRTAAGREPLSAALCYAIARFPFTGERSAVFAASRGRRTRDGCRNPPAAGCLSTRHGTQAVPH